MSDELKSHALWLRVAADSLAGGGKFDTAYLRKLADAIDAAPESDDPEYATIVDDDVDAQAVAAERGRQGVLTMALEDGYLPIPGEHEPSAAERLVALLAEGRVPRGGVSPAAEAMLVERSAGLTIGGMPIPGDTLSLEDVRSAAIVGRSMDSLNWSGEVSGGLPIPR